MLFNSYLLPETTAYLAQCTTQPSAKWTNALNTLIRQLIIDGNWQQLDRMWIFAAEGARQNARINVVNPANTGTWVSEVDPTHLTWTADYGYTGNGSSSYLNTNFNPSTAANYKTTNANYGIYSQSNARFTSSVDIGATDGTNIIGGQINRASNMGPEFYINSSVNDLVASTSASTGLYSIVRTGSTASALWVNGTSILTSTTSSTAIPSKNVYILGYNNNGTASNFSTRPISIGFLGSGGIYQAKLSLAINGFMGAI
ncbi:MAG TPA: hypothetical protein VK783_07190 [Bacteroidia bacterium]|jgi:hypothetical protein|nr:hypothetical protein [Bacteroidia bacterium]